MGVLIRPYDIMKGDVTVHYTDNNMVISHSVRQGASSLYLHYRKTVAKNL